MTAPPPDPPRRDRPARSPWMPQVWHEGMEVSPAIIEAVELIHGQPGVRLGRFYASIEATRQAMTASREALDVAQRMAFGLSSAVRLAGDAVKAIEHAPTRKQTRDRLTQIARLAQLMLPEVGTNPTDAAIWDAIGSVDAAGRDQHFRSLAQGLEWLAEISLQAAVALPESGGRGKPVDQAGNPKSLIAEAVVLAQVYRHGTPATPGNDRLWRACALLWQQATGEAPQDDAPRVWNKHLNVAKADIDVAGASYVGEYLFGDGTSQKVPPQVGDFT